MSRTPRPVPASSSDRADEEAAAWAAVALRHEPLLERAHRLFARGLAGQGNQPAARAALAELLARLADERLAPERDTELLAAAL